MALHLAAHAGAYTERVRNASPDEVMAMALADIDREPRFLSSTETKAMAMVADVKPTSERRTAAATNKGRGHKKQKKRKKSNAKAGRRVPSSSLTPQQRREVRLKLQHLVPHLLFDRAWAMAVEDHVERARILLPFFKLFHMDPRAVTDQGRHDGALLAGMLHLARHMFDRLLVQLQSGDGGGATAVPGFRELCLSGSLASQRLLTLLELSADEVHDHWLRVCFAAPSPDRKRRDRWDPLMQWEVVRDDIQDLLDERSTSA